MTLHSGPTVSIINDHLSQVVEGGNVMATERLWDLMQRASAPYSSAGLASFAISAVDQALWDLKGKILGLPVYELLGGPQKEKIFVYASNTDISYGTEHSIEWFLELGFKAVKLFQRAGPEDGLDGIKKTEELVEKKMKHSIREQHMENSACAREEMAVATLQYGLSVLNKMIDRDCYRLDGFGYSILASFRCVPSPQYLVRYLSYLYIF